MKIQTLIVALVLTATTHAEERTVEQTLTNLSSIIIPHVDFTDNTTVEEAVDFLNVILHSPDPPPPEEWRIRLDVPEAFKKKGVGSKSAPFADAKRTS